MKIKLKRDTAQIASTLLTLSQAMHPMTGERRTWRSLDALKEAVDLVRLVSQCLEEDPEDKRGEAAFLCRWHNDHNPSFLVNPEKRRWFCHPCGESGDAFDFVKKMYDLDHKAAVEWVEQWHHYHMGKGRSMRIKIRRGAR